MKFIHYQVNAGPENIIQVKLTKRANVRLMDTVNYQKYRMGKPYEFTGGLAEESPVEFRPEEKKQWHIIVDMKGLHGETKAGIRVLSC
ncbi:MAG: DUF1883 domain-containing protein [Spirochaetales bacterium]|nr:DUF1883 domain-containing protein [Spirochaetales bacterium]